MAHRRRNGPARGGARAGSPVTIMADGTIKAVHPLSGTRVWTVPGRGGRPIATGDSGRMAEGPIGRGVPCAFCPERSADVPPEKARVVRDVDGAFTTVLRPPPPGSPVDDGNRGNGEDSESPEGVTEFRLIPNLFEIVSYAYWRENHGLTPSPEARAQHEAWMSTARGRERVEGVLRARFLAAGGAQEKWERLAESERLAGSMAFFGGGHDLVVARRHLTDGPEPGLASSGTMSPAEHAAYTRFTVETMGRLYAEIPAAAYVATFQNWLARAGASFDHLHKQIVAIDEHGEQVGRELARLAEDPRLYDHHVALARDLGLVVVENDHAVAFAGFGHRHPTFEIYAKDPECRPFELETAQVNGMSDVLHALHVATGPHIACNEEWHHRPIGVATPMPWRIQLKWRTSTLAGFEGGTRIYVTTISPWELRDRALDALAAPDRRARLASGLRLGGKHPMPT
ncbi:DUF4921 family protein [Mobilicoccus caccae]|uniref:DUF4921 domain-containing protein n=1 Tax=Mobilicoccus caccae TaxID=1859295 RepID=A0ABQ6IZW7_9MICO|nr:DUF4921 family protein [Mobilicoccus caccae]GMA42247.1 hypothetical protein GCM10025883_42920 [Mobilicoccus caccae]